MMNINSENMPVTIEVFNSGEMIAEYPKIIPKNIIESNEKICDISD